MPFHPNHIAAEPLKTLARRCQPEIRKRDVCLVVGAHASLSEYRSDSLADKLVRLDQLAAGAAKTKTRKLAKAVLHAHFCTKCTKMHKRQKSGPAFNPP